MITVVTFKWGDRYTAEHVNVLQRMVGRHLHAEHEFLCITDDPHGLADEVAWDPLWPDLSDSPGCWRRLRCFSTGMHVPFGRRFVWLDLDAVIVDDITPLLVRTDPLVLWEVTRPHRHWCGSMVLKETGLRTDVWDRLAEVELSEAQRQTSNLLGTDQAWLLHVLGPDLPKWTRADGVMSYRFDCLSKIWRNRIDGMPVQAGPPPGARIVFFHGKFKPWDPLVRQKSPWIAEHWR